MGVMDIIENGQKGNKRTITKRLIRQKNEVDTYGIKNNFN
jgi:hypothetical protein